MNKLTNDELKKIIADSDEPQWLKELRLFGMKLVQKHDDIETALKRFPESKALLGRLRLIIEIENEFVEVFDQAVKSRV